MIQKISVEELSKLYNTIIVKCDECGEDIICLPDIRIDGSFLKTYSFISNEAGSWKILAKELFSITGQKIYDIQKYKGKDFMKEVLDGIAESKYKLVKLFKDFHTFYNLPYVKGYYLTIALDKFCYHRHNIL